MWGEADNNFLPTVGVMLIGLQRSLPLCQQLYHAWANLRVGQGVIDDIVKLLEPENGKSSVELDVNERVGFSNIIELHGVSFSYMERDLSVLRNVSLGIKRGEFVGLIGKSGSGKSTLINVITGLLNPTQGHMSVDTIPITKLNHDAWSSLVGYVPQSIFLFDSTIMHNIAFEIRDELIDLPRVRWAADIAHLNDMLEDLPLGFHTPVGERGARISGGQLQRIGLARALYRDAPLIIFDESTSAIDVETEGKIFSKLRFLFPGKTFILVTHRRSNLHHCDSVYEMADGNLIKRELKYFIN